MGDPVHCLKKTGRQTNQRKDQKGRTYLEMRICGERWGKQSGSKESVHVNIKQVDLNGRKSYQQRSYNPKNL